MLLSSSATEVPVIFTVISESSAASQRLKQAHVRKRCRKIAKFSRPRNSGMVKGINIPILVDDGAGAFSIGAAAAGAVARVSWSRSSGYMRDGLDGAGDLSLVI